MIKKSILAVAVPLLSFALPAQKGFDVVLEFATDLVMAGDKAEVVLTVDVKKRSSVPLALLSGLNLATTVDGDAGPKITDDVHGSVAIAAGTKLVRRITLDMKRLVPTPKSTGLTRVTLAWIGLEGVSTVVDVAPNLSNISLSALNLKQTKVLLVTNYGEILLKFYPDEAPGTVNNFVKLALGGYYDGTRFHRIMRNFMIQGGCPNTKSGKGVPGTGGPGYVIKDEFNSIRHVKGVVSMASHGPNTAGSQFFIMHAANPSLDRKYTAFGELVTGEDTLDKIASVAVAGPKKSKPVEPVYLKAAIVQPVFKKKKK